MTSHLLKTALLVLSLVACGTADTSASVGESQTSESHAFLATNVKPLTNWRTDALVAAFTAIDAAALDASAQTGPFGADALFASVDVSNPIADLNLTVVVPAGTTANVKDPNLSSVFYIVQADKAGTAKTNFGPFELHSQDGGPCGGFAVNALTCAASLHCQAHLQNADIPGVCVAN